MKPNDVPTEHLPPEAARFAVLLRESLPTLQEGYGVETLALFGSYVRDEQRPESDLDVLVEFARTPGLLEFIRLEQELTDLLGVRVELVMRPALRPPVGKYILDEAVPV